MAKKKLAIVLGIRPDVIRASLVLNQIRARDDIDVTFIWSGQHYSDNLKDVFFRELKVAPPEIELNAGGTTDAEVVGSVVRNLFPVVEKMMPEAVVFLGDTNTVMGCLAVAQNNVPVVHIEGCMRAYDWRMPEEKYRTTIDHLSDVIYTYFDEYKQQGVAEGLNPRSIVVVQNLIVDVLQHYYFDRKSKYDAMASDAFFRDRQIERGQYYLMTCHRRENVHDPVNLTNIVKLLGRTDRKVFFTASYRTQKQLKAYGLTLPANVVMVDPIGYEEILALMVNSRGVITDSGTVVEETAVLQVPSMQMRRATERPQVYDCGSSVKFDPSMPERYPFDVVLDKLEGLVGKTWEHKLGDGRASGRIVDDLVQRTLTPNGFRNHLPERYHLDIRRSYMDDGLPGKR
jgi:UDP-N-acetylglucosamine 2-epimerase (non-hydrolysing)